VLHNYSITKSNSTLLSEKFYDPPEGATCFSP